MACNVDEKGVWVTFFWNIENSSFCSNRGYYHQSPVFKVESIEKTSWKLVFYPFIKSGDCLSSCCLYGSQVHSIKIKSDVAILAEDGSVLQINEREKMDLQKTYTLVSELLMHREDVTMKKPQAFLSPDTLRFRCRLWRTDDKAVTPVTFFARTVVKVEERNFIWNIAKFSSLASNQEETSIIRSESNEEIIFYIGVDGHKEVTMRIISLNQAFFVKFHSFIIITDGSRIDCGKWKMTLNENEQRVVYALPFTQKNIMDNKEMYLKNDVLTLYCECAWSDGKDVDRIERIDYGISSPYITNQLIPKPCTSNAFVEQMEKMVDLKEDFESLYSKSILSDVILCTETQTFKAHKNILSARSPVFGAMFTTNVKEKIKDCVDVSDLEDDTVRRMLMYMYTNAFKDLQWESAIKLYAAADKYEIVALKSKCSSFLKCNLRSNNVSDVLILADLHKDGDLKKVVQDFALAHEDVFHSKERIVFKKTRPVLALETMLLKRNKL